MQANHLILEAIDQLAFALKTKNDQETKKFVGIFYDTKITVIRPELIPCSLFDRLGFESMHRN